MSVTLGRPPPTMHVQPDEEWAVVVVGGGPAGLAAARAAAAGGVPALLLERNNEIGIPVRTSGASWIEDMARAGVPGEFLHPTRRVRIAGPSAEARFEYEPPINCVLDVRGLYQHLAIQASRQGAAIRVRSRVSEGADGWLEVASSGRSGRLRASVVIDASGAAAVVARPRGLVDAPRRVGVGAELELYAPRWSAEELWLLVGSRVAPGGYGWIFPGLEGRVRAGVGLLSSGETVDPVPYLRRLIRETPALAGAAELEYHRGVIPSEGPRPRTVADGLLVVGDAAGQVLATAGEGIRFALELGELAGTTAAAAVNAGDASACGLAAYEQEWRRRYGDLFGMLDRLNRKLERFDDARWDSAVRWLDRAGPGLAARLMRGDLFQGTIGRRLADGLMPVLGWLIGRG